MGKKMRVLLLVSFLGVFAISCDAIKKVFDKDEKSDNPSPVLAMIKNAADIVDKNLQEKLGERLDEQVEDMLKLSSDPDEDYKEFQKTKTPIATPLEIKEITGVDYFMDSLFLKLQTYIKEDRKNQIIINGKAEKRYIKLSDYIEKIGYEKPTVTLTFQDNSIEKKSIKVLRITDPALQNGEYRFQVDSIFHIKDLAVSVESSLDIYDNNMQASLDEITMSFDLNIKLGLKVTEDIDCNLTLAPHPLIEIVDDKTQLLLSNNVLLKLSELKVDGGKISIADPNNKIVEFLKDFLKRAYNKNTKKINEYYTKRGVAFFNGQKIREAIQKEFQDKFIEMEKADKNKVMTNIENDNLITKFTKAVLLNTLFDGDFPQVCTKETPKTIETNPAATPTTILGSAFQWIQSNLKN